MLASLSGRRSGLFVLCLVTALLLGCATSPTGRRTLILHSGPEMAAMGVAAFTQMRGELPRSTNASQRALVQCVADAITGVLTPQDLGVVVVESWEVELFEGDSANAFALPGGKMGVYTGLLNVARDARMATTASESPISCLTCRILPLRYRRFLFPEPFAAY